MSSQSLPREMLSSTARSVAAKRAATDGRAAAAATSSCSGVEGYASEMINDGVVATSSVLLIGSFFWASTGYMMCTTVTAKSLGVSHLSCFVVLVEVTGFLTCPVLCSWSNRLFARVAPLRVARCTTVRRHSFVLRSSCIHHILRRPTSTQRLGLAN